MGSDEPLGPTVPRSVKLISWRTAMELAGTAPKADGSYPNPTPEDGAMNRSVRRYSHHQWHEP
jgi:hypothetical protein